MIHLEKEQVAESDPKRLIFFPIIYTQNGYRKKTFLESLPKSGYHTYNKHYYP